MFRGFRQAMAWVHTWFGLVLGFVLMACFFFGALSVFAREIDRWAVPATRVPPQPMPSFDHVLRPAFEALSSHGLQAQYWDARATRDPLLYLYAGYEQPGKGPDDLVYASRMLVAGSGAALPDDRLLPGSGFFYPLHYNLTLHWRDLGAWIVGQAALAMLAALVSGVVLHRRLLREFFTYRPRKALLRSTLDLHNLSGVAALPFHFFFAFTGLLVFAGIYFPVAQTQLRPLHDQHAQHEAAQTGMPGQRTGLVAPLASVDTMVAQARQHWQAQGLSPQVGALILVHVGDANGYVVIMRANEDRMTEPAGNSLYFQASTGALLRASPGPSAVASTHQYLTALHLIPFQHWPLRWLYFAGGLVGCVCIATGFVFFVEKRKAQHAKSGRQGARCVDALAVAAITGMLLATLALLVANRLLPERPPNGWPGRDLLEQAAFWIAWLTALLHAWSRGAPVTDGHANPAWRAQCRAIAFLAVAAVVLNGASTGDHLGRTLTVAYWPVAGVDLFLLATAAVAALAARRMAGSS